jgi:cyclic pyranopterin phosphate synthase
MNCDHRPISDAHGRQLRYLRVSVTDRCNLRCRYCMPEHGIPLMRHEDILAYEEIAAVARAGAALGVTSVRITGGEPLARRGIVNLVALLHEIEGIADLSMTTNGTLLAPVAPALARAGLHRVNVSIDSLDPVEYAAITRGGDLDCAMAGVEAALAAGLEPVKVNAVMLASAQDDGLRRWMEPFADLVRGLPVHVRFIEPMPLGDMTAREGCGLQAVQALESFGAQPASDVIRGAGPARYWRLDGSPGSLGLIAPLSDPFCDRCNRLRLTPRGEVRSCLFASPDADLMPLLRPRVNAAAIAEALSRCWRSKAPAGKSHMRSAGATASMCQIGG